ncbi:hypothetical protein DYI23_10480 [Roseibium polysiphoniae]|uniref:Tyrosine specific protein phosphatases domain-containing protein n=1 Tax=Roseibium polysiphoniae TaxID=2571221 RepID=A0A944CDT8_9HYPH|nr:hypothetical protein [Roseibium polysiphoniae]MBS8260645.1 hypothetical protein [Roseibium polysiphoniae]
MLKTNLQPLTFLETPTKPSTNLIVSGAPGVQIMEDGSLDLCEETLAAEMSRFHAHNVRTLTSLVEDDELGAVAYSDISDVAKAYGITVLRFPIHDFGTPTPNQKSHWESIRCHVVNDLQSGWNVAIHCLAGIGRSYMIAGSLLVYLGQRPEAVFSKIRSLEPEALETNKQVDYLWTQQAGE